jgi:hypothetical protein
MAQYVLLVLKGSLESKADGLRSRTLFVHVPGSFVGEEVRVFPECSNVHSMFPECSLHVP